jgi:hypothetical protein
MIEFYCQKKPNNPPIDRLADLPIKNNTNVLIR